MRPMMTLAILATLAAAPLALVAQGSPPAGAVPIDLQGCSYLEIVVKVPAADVDPLVPDDFALIFGADGMNSILLSGGSCDVATSSGQTGTGSFVSFLSRVQEPEDLVLAGSDAGVRAWFYRLEHYVQSGDLYRQVADAAGVDEVPTTALAVDSEQVLSTMTIQSADLDLRVLAPVTPQGLPLGGGLVRWREFHEVADGYAVLEATLAGDPLGGTAAGVVTASEGSLWHDLAGPANVGPLTYGRNDGIRDGWMGVLPKPS
ncbi:MAG TPA: hypothetical protein VGR28_13300 [Candidatus Thermoplasmatota archaeon]|nr:hypothetical protein [Candidatus Thermoplasmatota archaeon]